MSSSYLVVTRFSELVTAGAIDEASTYLDEDVVLHSWQGVAEGKTDVVSFLSDNRRFMHHDRSFNPWQHVVRSLEVMDLQHSEDEQPGYDGQGYAVFERLGVMATRPRFSVRNEKVRETIAVRNDYVVLIILSRR